jgi:hypothetical protein
MICKGLRLHLQHDYCALCFRARPGKFNKVDKNDSRIDAVQAKHALKGRNGLRLLDLARPGDPCPIDQGCRMICLVNFSSPGNFFLEKLRSTAAGLRRRGHARRQQGLCAHRLLCEAGRGQGGGRRAGQRAAAGGAQEPMQDDVAVEHVCAREVSRVLGPD